MKIIRDNAFQCNSNVRKNIQKSTYIYLEIQQLFISQREPDLVLSPHFADCIYQMSGLRIFLFQNGEYGNKVLYLLRYEK